MLLMQKWIVKWSLQIMLGNCLKNTKMYALKYLQMLLIIRKIRS